eukprot:420549-Rhodomonas_salina.1
MAGSAGLVGVLTVLAVQLNNQRKNGDDSPRDGEESVKQPPVTSQDDQEVEANVQFLTRVLHRIQEFNEELKQPYNTQEQQERIFYEFDTIANEFLPEQSKDFKTGLAIKHKKLSQNVW